MAHLNHSKQLAGVLAILAMALMLSYNSVVRAQDTFIIGTFWAPAETTYYHQVRDCGIDLIQQPTISDSELTAAARYGFLYFALEHDAAVADNVPFTTMR